MALSGCTVSSADLVVNVSALGVGGARTVTVNDIVLDGYALVVLGWDAASPVDAARVDTGDIAIRVEGVRGTGRLIVSGNFPNGTALTITSSTIVLNNSAASSVAASAFGCSGAMAVSSAICVSAVSVTYALQLGPNLVVQNTWDPPTAGSAYSGGVDVASSVALVVGDFGLTGRVAITGLNASVNVSTADVARSAAAVVLRVAANRILGSLNISSSELRASSGLSTSSNVIAGVVWTNNDPQSTSPPVVIGATANVVMDACRISVSASAQNATAILINASALELFGSATFLVTSSFVHTEATGGGTAAGVWVTQVVLTRSSMFALVNSSWVSTSSDGDALMLHAPVDGRFPSLLLVYENRAYVETKRINQTASWIVMWGSLTLDSQVLIHSNVVEMKANATLPEETGPVGVRIFDYSGAMDDASLNVSGGGTFTLASGNFSFGSDALLPIVMDGPADVIVFLHPGCVFQVMDLHVFGSPGTYLFSRVVAKLYPIDVVGYAFTLGCLQFNSVFPVYILSEVFNADILDMIKTVTDCDCSLPEAAVGPAYRASGTYPNCSFSCRRASSNPYPLLRDSCAQPTLYTFSTTITTKTMPPAQTATTYTDFLSETKQSLSLTNSTTLPHTTSPLPSKSLSEPLTHTPELTPSPTLLPSRSHTWTLPNNSSSMSASLSYEGGSASRSVSTIPTPTNISSRTGSLTVSTTVSSSASKPLMSVSTQLTRFTYLLSLSRGSSTVSPSRTRSLPVTSTYHHNSRTVSFKPPPPPFDFLVQSQALGFLTLALTSVASVLTSNPGVFHTQFIAVLGQMHAASENAYQRTLPMAYVVSPFWDFSKVVVAVANVLVILGVLLVHFGVTKLDVVGKVSGEPSANVVQRDYPALTDADRVVADEWIPTRFPELSFGIALVLYQGVVTAAFNIFYHESGPAFVIGTVCLLFTIALPLVEYWIMYGYLKVAIPPYRRVVYDAQRWWRRLLPGGYWSLGRVHRCFGRIYASMTDRGMKFTAYTFAVVLFVNAAASARAATQSERDAQFGVLGLIFLAAAIFVMVLRPHRSLVTNVVFSVSFVCLMMLCVCLANEATNEGAANGVPGLIVILEVILWCNGMYEVGVWYAEERGFIRRAREALEAGDRTGVMRYADDVASLETIGGDEEMQPHTASSASPSKVAAAGVAEDRTAALVAPFESSTSILFAEQASADNFASSLLPAPPVHDSSAAANQIPPVASAAMHGGGHDGIAKPSPQQPVHPAPTLPLEDDDFLSGFMGAKPPTSAACVADDAGSAPTRPDFGRPLTGLASDDIGGPSARPPPVAGFLERIPISVAGPSSGKLPLSTKPSGGRLPPARVAVKSVAKSKGPVRPPSSSDDSDDSDL